MKNLKYIVSILAAAAIAATFAGCSSDKNTSSTSGEVVYYDDEQNSYVAPEDSLAEAKANAVKIEGQMNTKSDLENVSITGNKAIILGVREADQMYDFAADRLAVEFSVTNNGTEAIELSGSSDFAVSVDGQNEIAGLNPTIVSLAVKSVDGFQVLEGDIEPGATLTGYITFEAASGWKEVNVSYNPFTENNNYDSVVYKITPDMVDAIIVE